MKYNITYSCGHTGTVDIVGNGAERERKLWWYENEATCKECYKAKMQQQAQSTPLTVVVTCDPYAQTFMIRFAGNTMPVKDDIKALGYYWSAVKETGMFGILSDKAPRLAWNKTVNSVEDLKAEVLKAAQALRPVLRNEITDADLAMFDKIKNS